MSNEEKSRFTSAELESPKKEISDRKKPKCGRCHIHGLKVKLSGHKTFCRYQNCTCPKCCIFLKQKRLSAEKIAITRAHKLSEEHKILPQEVPPLSLEINEHKRSRDARQMIKHEAESCKKDGLHVLVDHTWREMHNPLIVRYIHPKMLHIFHILVQYAYDLNAGIKLDARLELAKTCISQVIHEDPMSFMTFQQMACCYFAPPVVRAPDEGLVGIRSLQYPFQNFPIWPIDSLSILATSTSPFPENSLKPRTESSTESFTDPSTEPSLESSESSIDPSTESSTYY